MNWWNLVKQSGTVGAQLLWSGFYGCNNGCYGCAIVMSYTEINKVVSQWLLTFNLCVSVTWPLTCAFHIPCTHTPEIIDMHRGVCDNIDISPPGIHGLACKKAISQTLICKALWIDSLSHAQMNSHHHKTRSFCLKYTLLSMSSEILRQMSVIC